MKGMGDTEGILNVNPSQVNSLSNALGLCAECAFMRMLQNDRGSKFYLCERSATDPAFAKYPRLPVVQCPGYVARTAIPGVQSSRDDR